MRLTKKEKEKRNRDNIIEAGKITKQLQKDKENGKHIVILRVSNEIADILYEIGNFNIYRNRKKGYSGTYLVDLQHTVEHR